MAYARHLYRHRKKIEYSMTIEMEQNIRKYLQVRTIEELDKIDRAEMFEIMERASESSQ